MSVSAAAYAICREGLTNVRRHATNATEAIISIRDTGQALELTIADNGQTPLSDRKHGNGLTSMTQRAEAAGGVLTAGPNLGGGWLVAAQIPLREVRL